MDRTVLIIDDDAQIRTMLKMAVQRKGYIVSVVENGKLGLAHVRDFPTALVITDILMPEKDGIEIIGDLRRFHPEIKIIAMTGGGRIPSEKYMKMAEAMGANRLFVKPFDPRLLVSAVGDLIGAAAP